MPRQGEVIQESRVEYDMDDSLRRSGDHDQILAQFGDSLRTRRLAAGLTQERLAAVSGLDRSYVGSVERGERNISLINLCKLAQALGLTPSTLLERQGG